VLLPLLLLGGGLRNPSRASGVASLRDTALGAPKRFQPRAAGAAAGAAALAARGAHARGVRREREETELRLRTGEDVASGIAEGRAGGWSAPRAVSYAPAEALPASAADVDDPELPYWLAFATATTRERRCIAVPSMLIPYSSVV